MGSSSSCMKVEQFDESVQMPSISPDKPISTPSSLSPVYTIPSKQPPTVSIQDEGFKVKRNTDQYSTIWDFNSKVSS